MSLQRGLLVCCDLRSYSSADDRLQRELQELLVRTLDRAGEAAGLDRSQWVRQPKGDEEWAVLPATTPEHDVVDRYVRALAAELEHVNAYRVPHARLRMRMAIHFGVTTEGANGYPGSDAVLVSRLLDSRAARAGLEQTGADLVVVLSEAVYTSLVQGGYTTLRPADFRRVDVRVKTFSGHGWMWIPQGDAHAVRLEDEDVTPAAAPPAHSSPPAPPGGITQNATADNGSTVIQAGRDAHAPTQRADVIQNFDRNDQRASHFGPVYRGDERS
ncbi:hypothetical protein ACFFSW_33705 [Saccharothrix longispora]|uniref:Guanylate cyclase domain-containing protein n=1 Tax=Saccharothrix longispora TaxID=33920 RepID=A0ABU1Q3L7_9PSEU|nr:hypothetical protein [Saccharothrix longispora]MDR6597103.1 hypothetical protein [Saccharothrix longispora]